MLSTPPTRSSIVVAAATTILSSMPAPKARPIEFRVMCRSPAKSSSGSVHRVAIGLLSTR